MTTDRAALWPEAEDERDECDETRHHPDVAEHEHMSQVVMIIAEFNIYTGISPEDHHS